MIHHKRTTRIQQAQVFDLMAQKQYRLSPPSIHTQSEKSKTDEQLGSTVAGYAGAEQKELT
jgi:hypothetical protein